MKIRWDEKVAGEGFAARPRLGALPKPRVEQFPHSDCERKNPAASGSALL